MGTDLSGTLIGLVLFSCFAANITGKLSLAVFMGSFVKVSGGTDDHKLDRIQKSGFSCTVFSG